MPFVNHKYVPDSKADKEELRALAYLQSRGINLRSLKVIEETAFTNTAHKATLTDENEATLLIYGLIK